MYNKKKSDDDYMAKRFGIKYQTKRRNIERMVNHYIKSGNYVDAYLKTYNPKVKTKTVIKMNAYRIFNEPYFTYYLNKRTKELNDKMDKELIMDRERILKELEEILLKTKDKEQYATALKALDQLSKILGAYAPEKSEIEHKGIVINYVKPEDKDKKEDK